MRKSQLLGVLILFIAIAVFGTTNFYWVSTEIGTPTSLFGDSSGGGDDPLNPNVNPPFPPTPPASETTPPASETTPEATPGDQPGIDGSSGNWVLFSINGNLKFSGNAVSKGRTGTNATNLINGVKPVSFSSNAKINPFKNNFYIGPNATKENVVEFIGTWKPSFNDINLLDKKVYFSLPQDNSAKVKSDFNSAVAEAAKVRNDSPGSITGAAVITKSDQYNRIEITGNSKMTVNIGEEDIILNIGTFKIADNGEIQVNRNGSGRLFLFVNDEVDISGNALLKATAGETFVHLFYTGNKDMKILGNKNLEANIYQNSVGARIKISVAGNKKIKDIVSLNANVEIAGNTEIGAVYSINSDSVKIGVNSKAPSVYCEACELTLGDNVDISGGVVTGGNLGRAIANAKGQYIYAPNADITLKENSKFHMVIGNNVTFEGNVEITGPTHLPVSLNIPEIPISRNLLIAAVDNSVGGPKGFFTSPDGVTWTKQKLENYSFDAVGPRSAAGNASVYVIAGVATTGKISYSNNGTYWHDRGNNVGSSSFSRVKWLNGRFIAVGESGQGMISISTDGASWGMPKVNGYYPGGNPLFDVAYGDGLYLAMGENTDLFYSETGAADNNAWKSYKLTPSFAVNGLTFGNGVFVAVGPNTIRTITKNDVLAKKAWTERTLSGNPTLYSVAWNGSIFVAVGKSSAIYTSADTVTWTKRNAPSAGKELRDVQWVPSHNCFYVAASDLIFKSSDGVNWTSIQPKNPDGTRMNTNSHFWSIFGR